MAKIIFGAYYYTHTYLSNTLLLYIETHNNRNFYTKVYSCHIAAIDIIRLFFIYNNFTVSQDFHPSLLFFAFCNTSILIPRFHLVLRRLIIDLLLTDISFCDTLSLEVDAAAVLAVCRRGSFEALRNCAASIFLTHLL